MTSVEVLRVLFVVFLGAFLLQLGIRQLHRFRKRRAAGPDPHVIVERTRRIVGRDTGSIRRPAGAVPVDRVHVEGIVGLLAKNPPAAVVVEAILGGQGRPAAPPRFAVEIAASEPVLALAILSAGARGASGTAPASVEEIVAGWGIEGSHAFLSALDLSRHAAVRSVPAGYRFEDLWAHSFAVAMAARELAQGVPGVDRALAATLGLLHDIGKYAIAARFRERLENQWSRAVDPTATLVERERRVFGVDHAELGGSVARDWGIPTPLARAIALHHARPEEAKAEIGEEMFRALSLVRIANQLAKSCHATAEDVEVELVRSDILLSLGLEPSLELLLAGPARSAIARALRWIDERTSTPVQAVARSLSLRSHRELARAKSIPAGWLDDPNLAKVHVEPTPTLSFLRQKSAVAVHLVAADGSGFAAVPAGASDVRISLATGDPGGPGRFLATLERVVDVFGFSSEERYVLRFLVKFLLAYALEAGPAAATVDLRLKRGIEEDVLLVAGEPFALSRLVPLEEIQTSQGPDKARLVVRALIGGAFGGVLAADWFDRIEAAPDGREILFARSAARRSESRRLTRAIARPGGSEARSS